ncbi:MAG: hypothetical protein ACT4OF_05585 [Caulobacteraceae bacterium]
MTRLGQLLLGASILACFAGPARAEWSFSTGVDYTSGDYGEAENTTIYQVPFSAAYRGEGWAFAVTVPYVDLKGTGNIIPGGVGGVGGGVGDIGGLPGGIGGIDPGIIGLPGPAPAPAPPPVPTLVDEQGLGDVTVSFAWAPWQSDNGGGLTIGAGARLPTGDEEKSLGAGETIGSLSANYSVPLGDAFSLYAGAGYGYAFDSEEGGIFGGVGAQADLSSRFALGAGVDWAEATTTGFEDSTTATLFARFAMTDSVDLAGYVAAGLTDTSPDTGAGVRISFRP